MRKIRTIGCLRREICLVALGFLVAILLVLAVGAEASAWLRFLLD